MQMFKTVIIESPAPPQKQHKRATIYGTPGMNFKLIRFMGVANSLFEKYNLPFILYYLVMLIIERKRGTVDLFTFIIHRVLQDTFEAIECLETYKVAVIFKCP